tara:strand:- start:3172 stop:4560 length:1389 start_codon:yes stop_codon:yes gene_type:complete
MSNTVEGSRLYKGNDNDRVIFQGLEEGDNDLFAHGFRVIITNETTLTMNWWKAVIKRIRAYSSGFDGGKNSKRTHKVMNLVEVKRESEFEEHDYYDTVFFRARQDAQGGARNNKMTGGQLLQAEMKLLAESVQHDVFMIGFCGHEGKPHVDAATGVAEFHTTDADYNDDNDKLPATFGNDVRYNMVNGFWAQLFDNVKDLGLAAKFRVTTSDIAVGSDYMNLSVTISGGADANFDINGKNYTVAAGASDADTAAAFVATFSTELSNRALHSILATNVGAVITLKTEFKGAKIVVANEIANNTLAIVTAYTPSTGLAVDQAHGVCIDMIDTAPREVTKLVAKGKAVFLMTDSLYKNLQKTFRSVGELESMTRRNIDGVDVTMIEGVAIRLQDIEQYIDDDFGGVNKHRIMLTTPDNLVIAANATKGKSKVWHNEDENTNRTRTQFWMGADFAQHNLIHIAAEL